MNCGYRLIDTAEFYDNEKEIGDVLREYTDSGKLERKDVFITTKVKFLIMSVVLHTKKKQ